MDIKDFADRLDHLIGAYRSGALKDEEFFDATCDAYNEILVARMAAKRNAVVKTVYSSNELEG